MTCARCTVRMRAIGGRDPRLRLDASDWRPLAPMQPVFVACEAYATDVAAASPYAPGQGAARVE